MGKLVETKLTREDIAKAVDAKKTIWRFVSVKRPAKYPEVTQKEWDSDRNKHGEKSFEQVFPENLDGKLSPIREVNILRRRGFVNLMDFKSINPKEKLREVGTTTKPLVEALHTTAVLVGKLTKD